MGRIFSTTDGNKIERVSRWITIQHNYNPGKQNRLFYYAMDENGYREGQEKYNPENGLYLDFFRWNGRTWAIEQFINMASPWAVPVMFYDETEKLNHLAGYDSEDYYNPVMIELDECGERVRVYREVKAA